MVQGVAFRAPHARIPAVQPQRPVVSGYCFLEAALGVVDVAQVDVACIARSQFQRLLEDLNRLGVLSPAGQDDAQIAVDRRIVRREPQRPA